MKDLKAKKADMKEMNEIIAKLPDDVRKTFAAMMQGALILSEAAKQPA